MAYHHNHKTVYLKWHVYNSFHFEVVLIIYQIPCYNLICNKLYNIYISLLFFGKQFCGFHLDKILFFILFYLKSGTLIQFEYVYNYQYVNMLCKTPKGVV